MLEKPALADETIIACLRENYDLRVAEIDFLPIGCDAAAWAYRAQLADGSARFLKVRRGPLYEPALTVPHYLRDRGIAQVVGPLPAVTGALWAAVDDFALILYPYIEGRAGMEAGLTEQQWVEFGAVLKRIHMTPLSAELAGQIKQETFVPQWSHMVRRLQAKIDAGDYGGPYQRELAAFWQTRRDEIRRIVERTEALGRMLQHQPPEFVLCHSDIHTANILLDARGELHIVDWDNVLLAPIERDLMFVVGDDRTQPREANLFLKGYGAAAINRLALAYYRYEWVVQEIGDFGERVFLMSDVGAETRAASVREFKQLFDPGDMVEAAYQTESALQ